MDTPAPEAAASASPRREVPPNAAAGQQWNGLKTVQWTNSDIQFFVAGVIQFGLGVLCVMNPVGLLEYPIVAPVLSWLEGLTKLPPLRLNEGNAAVVTLLGAFLILLGHGSVMAVYTVDEKAKRNSITSRAYFSLATAYICIKTPYGTTAHVLLGALMAVMAFVLALDVGFGDGNAVDLEEFEARRRAALRLRKKREEESDKTK